VLLHTDQVLDILRALAQEALSLLPLHSVSLSLAIFGGATVAVLNTLTAVTSTFGGELFSALSLRVPGQRVKAVDGIPKCRPFPGVTRSRR
jgi:hypothetical protein